MWALPNTPSARERPPLLVFNPHARRNRVRSHTQRLLQLLARVGLAPEVCLEGDLTRARQRIRAAVRAGCRLVIAAGGDGTIEAIAPMLVNTGCSMGIIPLGTYNNVAASLQIPAELQAACELLSSGVLHPVDVGQVRARGLRGPRVFVEQASAGLAPLLAPVGESLEKGRWLDALRALPAAARLEPAAVRLTLDGGRASWDVSTLLITVCNAPKSAAGFVLAPDAQMDDGLLDVCVYEDLHQADLAARVFAFMTSGVQAPGVRRTRASVVELSTTPPSRRNQLLVSADVDVVGSMPARFSVLPGALQVIVPPGVAKGGSVHSSGAVPSR